MSEILFFEGFIVRKFICENIKSTHMCCSRCIDQYYSYSSSVLYEYQNMDFGFLDSEENSVDNKFDEFLGNLNHLVIKHCPKKN